MNKKEFINELKKIKTIYKLQNKYFNIYIRQSKSTKIIQQINIYTDILYIYIHLSNNCYMLNINDFSFNKTIDKISKYAICIDLDYNDILNKIKNINKIKKELYELINNYYK